MMRGAWGNTHAGTNLVDPADVYSAGESEEILGKALKGRRDEVVLATKFFVLMGERPNQRGGSRRWIVLAVEDSLRRLGTDWIDLYLVHRVPRHRRRRRAERAPDAGLLLELPVERVVLPTEPRWSARSPGAPTSDVS